ncbi:S-layer homology domain-containing protein [Microseira wollei]|uniref:S-layer domain-containing protein n=1 Tax=Microseira wollei NIES-4236 TaxID=2530354 RepID=A0AAV3XK25_9CYAN|nr:S-layer homology domain-containing protein [Microseira wollei]GET41385.1 S-layer domain-containing protein [Microseira wollei NIES-4236]
MGQFLSTVSLLVLLQGLPGIVLWTPAASAQSPAQPDSTLPADPIQRVLAARLMTNYPDGQFYPERLVSRAELASILVKAFELNKRVAATRENLIAVPDVPPSFWAFNDIQIVLKTGIMRGYRDNMFFPNQRVSRAEALAIFAQAYGVFQFPDQTVTRILSDYPDSAQIPDWAKKSMATALYEGFVKLDDRGNINPLNPMTRGDMAYALSKFLERQKTPAPVLEGEYFRSTR